MPPEAGHLAFVLLAVNPVGGLVIALPVAILALGYPAWLAVAAGVPLAYVQVLAVDLGWSWLERWRWWRGMLERRRSARVERLVASGGAFWATVAVTPVIGPWAVMAFMRYARVPQRRVAAPILVGIAWSAAAIAALCLAAPERFRR